MMKPNESAPILCGTDFSGNARQAANVAAAVAKRLSAPLVLVHAKGMLIHASTPDVNDALIASASGPETAGLPGVAMDCQNRQ